jgi:hypothetical protein
MIYIYFFQLKEVIIHLRIMKINLKMLFLVDILILET